MELRWIILGVVLLICAAIALEAWLKRGRARRLGDSRPGKDRPLKSELGMEATDISLVAKAHAKNEDIERRNNQRHGPAGAVNAATKLAKRIGDKND